MAPKATVALAAALALVAATAPTPAAANLWGDLASLDAKKDAIEDRIDEKLGSFKNATRAKLEHGADVLEAKLYEDKEEQAKGLEIKLANLTEFKDRLDEGKAAAKMDADAKFWRLMNKTDGVHEAKKAAIAKLANKTMALSDKAAYEWETLKNASVVAKDATGKKVSSKPDKAAGAKASSLKLPSAPRAGVPGGGAAFFAAPGEPAPEAAGDVPAAAAPAPAPAATGADAAPTAGSGVPPTAGGPPAATAAFQVELPKDTTSDWTPAKQTAFTSAVAAWAQVPAEAVTVQAVSSDGGVVDTAVDFADEAAAAGFARRLASDAAGLAAATDAAGLGAAKPTDVKVAGTDAAPDAAGGGGGKAKGAGLSPGAIAGITIGSAAGACVLAAGVAAGVVASKRKGAGGTPLTTGSA